MKGEREKWKRKIKERREEKWYFVAILRREMAVVICNVAKSKREEKRIEIYFVVLLQEKECKTEK